MVLLGLLGILLVLAVLWDGFESMVMTRNVTLRWRISRIFYLSTRPHYFNVVRRMKNQRLKNAALMSYTPGSLLLLIALWACLIILGYALINFGFQIPHREGSFDFPSALYYSGVTFLTLGYGDLAPITGGGRFLAVVEAGSGFVFLAIVIGYLPVMYAVVQRREYAIILLDSKASSDPTGFELIRRHAAAGAISELTPFLAKYEQWGAEMLEAYLAYPITALYRSQHDDQSWVRAATAIMDACALIKSSFEPVDKETRVLIFQAGATFASLRHVMVDLAYLIKMPPQSECAKRLSEIDYAWLMSELQSLELPILPNREKLNEIRMMYEPYALSLGHGLIMEPPVWRRHKVEPDNWQIAAWDGGKHPQPDASKTEAS
jgi:hypothetical protein